MKLYYYLFLFASFNITAQGLNFSSNEELREIDSYSFDEKGFTDNLPYSYSMEKYVPPILKQKGGSCVGFSTFYYALSTSYNIEYQYTDWAQKYANSFDPYFVYSIMNNLKNDCEDGLIMYKAIEMVSKMGSKKMFFPRFLACDSSWDKEKFMRAFKHTEPYKIKNFYYINLQEPELIRKVKGLLTYDIPVIIAANTTKSLDPFSSSNPYGVPSNGLWSPMDNEKEEGGHAMCVIGYDDYKFGGCFRIANSWGSDYGDNGFLWIKYSDFEKYVLEAYVIEPADILDQGSFQRVVFTSPEFKGHIYEGGVLNRYFHGYGIYSFNDGTYLIGEYNNGSKEGWFVFINKHRDDYISMYNYQNDLVIDTRSLGFSEIDGESTFEELKNYLNFVSPEKKVLIINEDPDFTLPKIVE